MGEGSEEDKKYSLKLYTHSQSLHGHKGHFVVHPLYDGLQTVTSSEMKTQNQPYSYAYYLGI